MGNISSDSNDSTYSTASSSIPNKDNKDWNPKFKVGDCVKWGKRGEEEKMCIEKIEFYGAGGVYIFKDNNNKVYSIYGSRIDEGDFYGADHTENIAPAELITVGGKSKTRRNLKSKKSKKNIKTNRRR